MHIPDGFLSARVAAGAGALSVAGLGVALRYASRRLPRRRVPLMGLTAAVLFAAQMINFPVAGGTSGHLVGSVLAAVLLGPEAAIVVLAAVLIVQCLLFADGGVLALGANILNMGIVATAGGWVIYRAGCACLPGERGRLASAAFAAWCATVMASLCCAGELAASGWGRPGTVFRAVGGIHMLIGLGEATITTLVLAAVWRARPELLAEQNDAPAPRRRALAWGMGAAVGLAVFVAPFACRWPDGLERVIGKSPAASPLTAPIPDYQLPGLHWAVGATALGGAIGTLVAFALALLLARILTPRRQQP